jgi:hypothetical protein
VADVNGIDFNEKRELDKNQIDRLFTCELLKKGRMFLSPAVQEQVKATWLLLSVTRLVCLVLKYTTPILLN